MIDRDTLIKEIMTKFVGTPSATQERRRKLYEIANSSLAKLADEFKIVFPEIDPYELGLPARKRTTA